MKALLVLAPGIGALLLFASATIRASEGNAQPSQVVTSQLHARTTTFVEIHNGMKGRVGDLLTFTHSLTDRGKHVGRDQGYCVRILKRSTECAMTAFLRAGQIEVTGPFDGSSRLAITGGTGAYTRARGWVRARRAGFFQLDLTYNLILG